MNNSLKDIVNCDIEISSPPSGEATFDTILLVVKAPLTTGKENLGTVTPVSSAAELLDYGYTVNDEAYKAATIAFSQSPAPDKLYLTVRTSDDDSFEDIETTLNRANQEADFYGIHLTEFKASEDVTKAVAWTEANNKMFGFEYTDHNNCPVNNFAYFRSFGVYSGDAMGFAEDEQPAENKYAALAVMAKCFGYEPGSETWHLKELATIVPSALSTARKESMSEKNISMYLQYAGKNVTFGGKTLAGEWIDVIRFRDWLVADLQINVFRALQTNRKIPYTDNGIGLIENAMNKTLRSGQRVGGIAETEYDEDGNPTPGYVLTVPKASTLSEAERKSRVLTGCSFKARLAGAIHAVEIKGNLTN